MRAIICGGRGFDDAQQMNEVLKNEGVSFVIEGGASGADALAWRWARKHLGKGSDHAMQFQARWDLHGRAAGPIRNQAMLDQGKPQVVIAFDGGRGTADMIRRAKRAGVPVLEIEAR